MVGREQQNLPHCRLGIFDRTLPIAGDAIVDPGIGELRRELDRGRERLLGSRRLIVREPGLAVNVMCAGIVGRAVTRLARSRECGLHRSARHLFNRGFQKCRGLFVRPTQLRHAPRNATS
jgi:hypothetical protein